MRFGVLGPLEVRAADGTLVELGSPKLRALLTLLLTEPGTVVSVDRIVDELWGDVPPPTATGTLQSYVSHLRRLLEPGRASGRSPERLLTRAPGYLIAAEPDGVDLLRFPRLLEQGTALLHAGRPQEAEPLLEEAIGLWRGRPFSDLGDGAAVTADRTRLDELHLIVREQLATVRLRTGQADRAVPDLERLVGEHPLRERVWARLVEALYAGHRQADALEAYRTCARLLRDELGLEPGPELRALEQAVLRQDLEVAVSVSAVPAAAIAEPVSGPVAEAIVEPVPVPSQRVALPEERPLVGRRAERSRLRAALAEVTRGSGAVLVLEGEAGIGKTRLAEAATAMAGAQGWRMAWSRCADDTGAPALWPWTQLLSQLDAGGLSTPDEADPDRSRFALFQDLRARLGDASRATPLMVVLDDVQAADATSLQLLALLVQHLEGLRLLVVLTVRTVGEDLPVPVSECLAALAREARVQRLQLAGLGESDVRELVSSYVGADDAGLVKQLHARTDGNPFFVVELARLLHSQDGAGPTLPPSVRDVITRRLGGLPENTVRLLELAAVIGRDVDLPLLQLTGDLEAEQVLAALEPAIASGVVLEQDVWRWRFSHALVQETLVARLSRLAAARLHARVCEALQAEGNLDVERLAHHSFHAVPVLGPAPARRWATEAAEAARLGLGHNEAAQHTRRALSLLGPSDDPRDRHDLLVALGDDLLRDGRPGPAQVVIGEALDRARQAGDPDRLAEAASVWGGVTLWNWRSYGARDQDLLQVLRSLEQRADDDPAQRVKLLGTLGVELAYGADDGEGAGHVTRAVELARELGDVPLLGRALNNFAVACWRPSRFSERLASHDEALALVDRGLPARTEFIARLHRGPLRLQLCDVAGFEDDLAAATRLAEALTGPEVRPYIQFQQTGLAMHRGDWEQARVLSREASELFQRTSIWGARFLMAIYAFTFGQVDGRPGDGLDDLVDACEIGVPLVEDLTVLAAARAGDREEARRLRRRWPQRWVDDWTTSALVVVRAHLALALEGDIAAAYEQVLPFAGRQVVVGTAGAVWGSYDTVLADLAEALGDRAQAAHHRAAAVEQGRLVGSPWQVDGSVRPI